MPPIGMFKNSHRLQGLEFGSCKRCNEGSKAADAAVAFFARIDALGSDVASWKIKEAVKFLSSADDGAPGFIAELFAQNNDRDVVRQTAGGVLVPLAEFHAGPIGQALLNVFAAKLGMAMYHEHVGTPLPRTGGVHGMWFLNAGMVQQTADAMLAILPVANTLKAGKKNASGQFDYRYNTDEKSVVAALTHFQGNIHFFTIAMADPDLFGFPRSMPFSAFIRPGQLLQHMPPKPAAILMPQTRTDRYPSLILPRSLGR